MPKIFVVLIWASGLTFGLAIGAFIACPYWKFAVPAMLFISVAAGKAAYDNIKSKS